MRCKTSAFERPIGAKHSTICELIISVLNVLNNQLAAGFNVTAKQRHGAAAAPSAGDYAKVVA